MKFTFGIITDGSVPDRILKIIKSIQTMDNITRDDYEIIIVGGGELLDHDPNIRFVPFDENKKKAHITLKKNLIFQLAQYDNISVGHDFIEYSPDFYQSMNSFDQDWDVVMCRVVNNDGSRFRDWMLYLDSCEAALHPHVVQWLDYDVSDKGQLQYISMSYYMIKKNYALLHPLDETRSHGEREDTSWSIDRRDTWRYKMNKNTFVKFMKQKEPWPPFSKEWNWSN